MLKRTTLKMQCILTSMRTSKKLTVTQADGGSKRPRILQIPRLPTPQKGKGATRERDVTPLGNPIAIARGTKVLLGTPLKKLTAKKQEKTPPSLSPPYMLIPGPLASQRRSKGEHLVCDMD